MTNMTYSIVANSNDTISMNVATGSNLYTNVVKHCLEPGCYTIFMNGGIGFEWSVQEDPGPLQPVWMDNLLLAEGMGTSAVTFIVGDGAGTTGCTDDMACNFDPMAICDDESCCYENCFQVAMESSSPPRLAKTHWIIENVASGSIIATGTMGPSLGGGSALTVDVGCLDPGCYVIYVDDGPAVYTPSYPTPSTEQTETPSRAMQVANISSRLEVAQAPDARLRSLAILILMPLVTTGLVASPTVVTCPLQLWNRKLALQSRVDIDGRNRNSVQLFSSFNWLSEHVRHHHTNHPICLEHGCYTISMETGGWLTPVDWSLHFPTHSIGGSTGFEELFHFLEL